MITQGIDPQQINRRVRQIKTRMPGLLSQWGLVPKFKRWRLTQDPDSGMVVLFGVLNNKYIATHSTLPFSDYFDPRLLHDLSTELHVQVVSSSSDGLRYAFILEMGELLLPAPEPAAPPLHFAGDEALPSANDTSLVDEHTDLHQRLDTFLKITRPMNAMNNTPRQALPDVLLMDQAEFNRQMSDYDTHRENNNPEIPQYIR